MKGSDEGSAGSVGTVAQWLDPKASGDADYRINVLIRALERHGAPCVLVLDEVERLQDREALAVLNALLRYAPGHLHVAMAYRERPPALDVTTFLLEGRAATLTVEDLRFSPPDIARFLGRRLSRRELRAAVGVSEGWPIALCCYRNAAMRAHSGRGEGGASDLVAGWIETHLWRDTSERDRDFVLDIALFERIEPELIEEVAGVRNAGRKLASMGALAGLLSTTEDNDSAMRLHPMIKGYCEMRRYEETPERFRTLHRRIAEALAKRGRTVEALRHAVEVSDTRLIGQLAESVGGVTLWLDQGIEALRKVDRLLTEEVLGSHPRLALWRCLVLTVSGETEAAARIFRDTAARTDQFTRDREGGDDAALQIEHLLVLGLVEMCGCAPYGESTEGRLRQVVEVAGDLSGPLLRGAFELGISMFHNQSTAFDAAVEWAERARQDFGVGSPYLALVDLQMGSAAMARGNGGEARRRYERAMQIASGSHLRDAGAMRLGRVLAAELELQRSAGSVRLVGINVSPRLLGESGAWLDVYAAHAEVRTELALLRKGPQSALAVVDQASEYARRTNRVSLTRFLSALRVSVLVAGGEVGEAVRTWRIGRLPTSAEGCTDVKTQSWREAEMLACSRHRLLFAQGELEASREALEVLLTVARQRKLVRMTMWGLALSVAFEHRAGNMSSARTHLLTYLQLYASTRYAWPLARECVVAQQLIDEVASLRGVDDTLASSASRLSEALRQRCDARGDPLHAQLTNREIDVLVRLETHRDMEIAEALNLSYDGLRYRVKCIFQKLGARSRLDAVHRARAMGILPAAEP